jgi:hypothetical protein
MIIDQPQHGHLLLCQLQVSKAFSEMAVDRAVCQTDMKTDDITDLANIFVTRHVGRGDC